MDNQFLFVKHYLISHRRYLYLIGLLLSSLVLFAYIFEGYRNFLLYLTGILAFLSLLLVIWDAVARYQACRKEVLYGEGLPETPLELVLSQKLATSQQAQREQTTVSLEAYNDLMDYYTLWAHQIKTPIAASQLLVQNIEDSDLRKQMEQELFKIDSYANLVLQYLRLESFHDDLVLKRVPLEELVKEVVRKYAIFFIQKGLTVDLHDLDVAVITDRKWLLVIIEQLLSNSLKYTSTGGIEIFFNDQTLYIKDSGIGIKDSDIFRVFERGFSGYNGHLTQQSSGLGLYLTKKIADQLGHQIQMTSQVSQGTTVAIRFEEKKLVMD
ncbi:sensor histidine kinase [Streptococcus ilei]|uniref:sensor histidine kinase n=1 Tax=Streptococcus ilei TaxID=1156431 RepID=UPI0003B93368|nr:sensor histidine kinase [Streptococcus ilei]AGY37760.1 sensor histidine kinase [Streptococcus ilei]